MSENKKLWSPFRAVAMVTGFYENVTVEEYFEAYQYIYDTGLFMKLEGHIGRTLADLIDQGLIKTEV